MMLIRLFMLVLAGLCVPQALFAAVGSAAIDTWYVRPAGACQNNGDGLAYGCAETVGGTGAFVAFSSVIWTATTGVDDGDILYVCGAHQTELLVGGSGAVGTPIILDGACPNDPGSIDTSSLTGAIEAIEIADRDYITVRRFGSAILGGTLPVVQRTGIRGAKRHAVFSFATATRTGITIEDNVVDNRTASHPSNVCHGIYFSGSGAGAFTVGRVRRNVSLGTSQNCANQSNNDSINIERASSDFIVEDNYGTGGNEGIDISSNVTVIQRNRLFLNRFSGLKVHGISVCPVGMTVVGNEMWGNAQHAVIFQDTQNTTFANNTLENTGGAVDALRYELVNACTHTGNNILNNIIRGDYSNGVLRVAGSDSTKATFEGSNTIMGNVYDQSGSSTTLIYFNNDTGNNVTKANFSTWQSAHAKERNQVPDFLSLVTPRDWRLDPTSTLRRAGVWWGWRCQDVFGRECLVPPDIGAHQGGIASGRQVR